MLTKFNRKHLLSLTTFAVIAIMVVGLFANVGTASAQGPTTAGNRAGRGLVTRSVMNAIVKVTGLTRLEVYQQWVGGKTLTEIITAKSASVDAVKTEAKTQATEAINQAQSNGRLTKEQADKALAELDTAIETALTTTFAEAGEAAGRRMAALCVDMALFQATLEATKLTREALFTQLSAEGATFASVIQANGATVDAVKTAAKTAITTRINEAVKSGRLAQKQADEMLANLDTALDTAINTGLPEGLRQRGEGRQNRAERLIAAREVGILVKETADQTGVTQRDILQQLRDGKTLAEIAKAKNIEVQTIVTAAATTITEQINQQVKNGRLTQAQADEVLKDLTQSLTDVMNKQNPLQGQAGRGGRGGKK